MRRAVQHKRTYDSLAEDYERRVGATHQITKETMSYFSSFLEKGGRILDVGCGVGTAMRVLGEMGFRVEGVDISPQMTAFARKRNPDARVLCGDFMKTDFEEKYDGVLAFAFIHLFPKKDVAKALKKIKSVLKPKGVALVSTTVSLESKEG